MKKLLMQKPPGQGNVTNLSNTNGHVAASAMLVSAVTEKMPIT